MTPSPALTQLLQRWKDGDRAIENQLANAIYPMLREIARNQSRKQRHLTMSTTDLANESFVRIAQAGEIDWQDRHHFLAIAANVMRRVAIDHLRRRSAEKRGGSEEIISLEDLASAEPGSHHDQTDEIALDQALTELTSYNPEIARVVELRLFAGLEMSEIGEVLGISVATVGRHWRFARVWIADRLQITLPQTAQARN